MKYFIKIRQGHISQHSAPRMMNMLSAQRRQTSFSLMNEGSLITYYRKS